MNQFSKGTSSAKGTGLAGVRARSCVSRKCAHCARALLSSNKLPDLHSIHEFDLGGFKLTSVLSSNRRWPSRSRRAAKATGSCPCCANCFAATDQTQKDLIARMIILVARMMIRMIRMPKKPSLDADFDVNTTKMKLSTSYSRHRDREGPWRLKRGFLEA